MRFLSICFLLVFTVCTKDEEPLNVVARAGGAVLTKEELAFASVFTEKERLSYIDNWVNTELLYQAGSRVGLDRDLLLETKINLYRKKLVGQAYLETKIQGMVSVTKDEIRNYYIDNKAEFKRLKSEATINSFILTDKKEANRVRANLEKPSNNKKRNEMFQRYGVVAETFADGLLNPKINKKVFGANKNKYIGPVDLGGKLSVIEVIKRYERGTYLGLDSVYDKIYLLIYKRKAAIKTQTIIDSLKHENVLVVDDLVDTGFTLNKIKQHIGTMGDVGWSTATLYFKPQTIINPSYTVKQFPNDEWIVFPWET